eukprot:gnl/TRDRNA2_/TRDRNA2_111368_c2_seq1.p1 gnl/TRDRNA2_/TRDRNA2_111368_c2~~gnl/TRDRNA2_/TRDRNA2_111368_c2_seq1.p1  ORF type:complete len:150 (+),score=14.60 gnl/TRDRNA2_/TRDRNA2_111368_c2_seq1:130-579(+)
MLGIHPSLESRKSGHGRPPKGAALSPKAASAHRHDSGNRRLCFQKVLTLHRQLAEGVEESLVVHVRSLLVQGPSRQKLLQIEAVPLQHTEALASKFRLALEPLPLCRGSFMTFACRLEHVIDLGHLFLQVLHLLPQVADLIRVLVAIVH